MADREALEPLSRRRAAAVTVDANGLGVRSVQGIGGGKLNARPLSNPVAPRACERPPVKLAANGGFDLAAGLPQKLQPMDLDPSILQFEGYGVIRVGLPRTVRKALDRLLL